MCFFVFILIKFCFFFRVYYHVSNKERLQEADWGPKNNILLFIKNNDIHVVTDIDENMNSVQVTNTGLHGVVYNGMSDWVYEGATLKLHFIFVCRL